MKVRAIWILKHGGAKNEVVYSRHFGSVENHARRMLRDDYVPVPASDEVLVKMLSVLRLPSSHPKKYYEARDNCEKFTSAPVYDLVFGDGGDAKRLHQLSIVAVVKTNYVLCCLPLAAGKGRTGDSRMPFGVTAEVLDLLSSIEKILNKPPPADIKSVEVHTLIAELDAFLDVAMPLGRPIDTDSSVIMDKITSEKTAHAPIKSKQPAWKPLLHKGKPQISMSIMEYVRSVQYDRAESPNIVDVYGSVHCTALLEGSTSEVMLTIAHNDLQNVVFHPCISAIDDHDSGYYKVRFMPSNADFVLCSYNVVPRSNTDADMPVCGVFKLRGDSKTVDFWLQLRLSSRLKNSFDHFEATIPFFNRTITQAELKPSWGMSKVLRDRRNIVWSLGYKFPSKTLDASLNGTILFDEADHGMDLAKNPDQLHPLASFCVNLNCFAQITFKTKSDAYSSCNIDPKSVLITLETLKHKFALDKSFESADCKIWNSYGDVPKTIQLNTQKASVTHDTANVRKTIKSIQLK